MAQYRKPLPRPLDGELTAPFWEAARRHELIIPRCTRCNFYFWYPRQECPRCLQPGWQWEPAVGKGRLHTFTVVRQPANPAFTDDVPYAYAVIQLDEGPRIVSNMVQCDVEDLKVDMRVEAVFDDVSPEWTLVKFRPA